LDSPITAKRLRRRGSRTPPISDNMSGKAFAHSTSFSISGEEVSRKNIRNIYRKSDGTLMFNRNGASTQSLTQSLSHSVTHSLSHTHTHSLIHTNTHVHTYVYSHSHADTYRVVQLGEELCMSPRGGYCGIRAARAVSEVRV
jgi:hypothetical protein